MWELVQKFLIERLKFKKKEIEKDSQSCENEIISCIKLLKMFMIDNKKTDKLENFISKFIDNLVILLSQFLL